MPNDETKSLKADSLLGHYRIVKKLGAGGMGEVFLAQDTKLDRKVALKILPPEFAADADRMNRFVREAKSASALNHPNIIIIHEIGESEGTHFIATEFIDGTTLSEYAKNKPFKFKSVLEIAIQIASALDEAHSAGIVHRDIKPDNVMIRSNGLVKILDFGIAKLSGSTSQPSLDEEAATAIKSTSPGMIFGTANYMSPEQAKGKEVDARTDIFSFGVVLYEMISGKLPFEGETAMEMIGAILKDEPKPINNSDVPPEIKKIIGKCLRKDRNERYQTIKDVLIDLRDVKQELEFQNKLERTISPEKEEPKTQILQARTADEINQTTTKETIAGKSKSNRLLAIGLAILLIPAVGFFGYRYYESTLPINSIAVLPFVNNSSSLDTEYLSDGLAESLIYRLSQLPNLKVSPTSSVFRYKGKETDAIKIGNELGVNAVLSGRIIQRGDNLNISVELVDVRNNKLIWGEQYERKMSELLATQREIATEITQKLQLKLSGEEKGLTKRYTNNNEAYQLYLKGRYHFAKRTKDDMQRSIEYFQQAGRLDPNFALAYASIAEYYNVMPFYAYLSPKEAFPQAKAAAQRALEIDPTLAEAHTALAYYLATYEWNWAEAERSFKRAIELDPNNSGAHFRYGQLYLSPLGRHDEAIAELRRAIELEPLALITGTNLAEAYMRAGQNDRALEQARKTYELEPNFPVLRYALGQAYITNGMYTEAIALSEKALQAEPTNKQMLRVAGYSYAKQGHRQEAEEVIKRFRDIAKTQYVMSYYIASIYAALGDKEKAFAELEKAYEQRDWELHRLKVDPLMNPLRDDPRFKDLLKRMNLPE
ncbi:MAG: protein kinase [Acidobacteriota bacterium]|nr:protein kinase [Acidobacteriota bacterium]